MKNSDVIEYAANRLNEATGLKVDLKNIGNEKAGLGQIQLCFQNHCFTAIACGEIRSFNMPKLLYQFREAKDNNILISQYIPTTIKGQLRENDVNYLEASGNCFIKTAGLFLFINDKHTTEARSPIKGKLWNATGLKFIFAILTDRELINKTYREMAKKAGIALGSINLLLSELKAEGFLIEGNMDGRRHYFIINGNSLLSKWAELYSVILKPKIHLGRYKMMNNSSDFEKVTDPGIIWGGENAGLLLTNYLHPGVHTIYTNDSRQTIMKKNKLVPDVNGKIEIIAKFWSDELQDNLLHRQVVPPLIAYADLIGSLDSRNHETAVRIKTQHLNGD